MKNRRRATKSQSRAMKNRMRNVCVVLEECVDTLRAAYEESG